jgi:hypothetical protein
MVLRLVVGKVSH